MKSKNCHFNFFPKGENFSIMIQVKDGKLFSNGKKILHQFTFKVRRKIFIFDENGKEIIFLDNYTVRSFLNLMLNNDTLVIRNKNFSVRSK